MRRALVPFTLGFALALVACDKRDAPTASVEDAATPAAAASETSEDAGSGVETPTQDGEDASSDEAGAAQQGAGDPQGEGDSAGSVASAEGTDAGATTASDTAGPAAEDSGDKPQGPPPLPKARYSKIDKSCGKDPGVGQKLKSFSLKSLDGKKLTNRSWGNRVLLVNFWGTWCKPCLKELPEFARLYRRYRKHGLVLVAIATDDDSEPVKAILSKSKISAKVAVGGEDYASKYNSPKFPFSFVVDPKGTIVSSFRGYEPKCMGKLEADIRAELEKRSAG